MTPPKFDNFYTSENSPHKQTENEDIFRQTKAENLVTSKSTLQKIQKCVLHAEIKVPEQQ